MHLQEREDEEQNGFEEEQNGFDEEQNEFLPDRFWILDLRFDEQQIDLMKNRTDRFDEEQIEFEFDEEQLEQSPRATEIDEE
ncbi:hypothetical protein LOK49_LG06G02902 [Camellia lanceoleosa]|uniref:Uncharacterized protein n=1 Tax=Camellia lanceoleosa TaxID=1840588 RepID=A0ACC0HD52_9ERIC|nr:hypothetical protein LOK49_LG06G02902 [Camellia lanceoleosa]